MGQGVGHFALHCECLGSTSLCTRLHAIMHSHTVSGLFSQAASPVWAAVGHARRSTEIVSILVMLGPVYLRTMCRSSSSFVSGWRTSTQWRRSWSVYGLQSSTECEGAERPRGDGSSGWLRAEWQGAQQVAQGSFVALQPANLVASTLGWQGQGG